MSKKQRVICPFCGQKIPYKYEYETLIRKKKRNRNKIFRQKIIIGVDYDLHKRDCKAYQNFIKTK